MKIDIQAHGVKRTDVLLEHVEQRLGYAFTLFQDQSCDVVVRLSGVSGPKVCIDERCYLGVRLNRLSEIVVVETEANSQVVANPTRAS